VRTRTDTQTATIAGGRLATSAQPPRATLTLAANVSYQRTPLPTRSLLPLDTPDALREGLRCSTASRPLPHTHLISGGTPPRFLTHWKD
jgi:hypothetical protein